MGGEDNHTFVIPTPRNKCKRKEGDSEEEEEEDDDSEDQGDEDDEEEEESGGKKGKKAEICEEEVSDSMMFLQEPAVKSVFVILNVSLSIGLALMRSFHLGQQCTLGQYGGAGETDRENIQGKLNPMRHYFLSQDQLINTFNKCISVSFSNSVKSDGRYLTHLTRCAPW